jgi:hypothetical protein
LPTRRELAKYAFVILFVGAVLGIGEIEVFWRYLPACRIRRLLENYPHNLQPGVGLTSGQLLRGLSPEHRDALGDNYNARIDRIRAVRTRTRMVIDVMRDLRLLDH